MTTNSRPISLNSFIYPPGYILPKSIEDVSEYLKKVIYPDGFSCYTPSESEGETTLIYNEIIAKQEYFRYGLSVAGARCVFDVGANIGLFTLVVKMKVPDASVYAFEPIPETYHVLEENVRLQECTDVHLFNVAVGSQDRTEKVFSFFPHMPGNSTSVPDIKHAQKPAMDQIFGKEASDYFSVSESRSAQVRTISSIIRECGITCIDYLKIDVEGDELSVLEGIEEIHWPFIRQVVVETHTELLKEKAHEYIASRNYEIYTDAGLSSPMGVSNLYAQQR